MRKYGELVAPGAVAQRTGTPTSNSPCKVHFGQTNMFREPQGRARGGTKTMIQHVTYGRELTCDSALASRGSDATGEAAQLGRVHHAIDVSGVGAKPHPQTVAGAGVWQTRPHDSEAEIAAWRRLALNSVSCVQQTSCRPPLAHRGLSPQRCRSDGQIAESSSRCFRCRQLERRPLGGLVPRVCKSRLMACCASCMVNGPRRTSCSTTPNCGQVFP